METIKNYLDNMFARLPKTNDIVKIKIDLLANMEDKYNELKSQGKSENEAVGIVISEFGNIDELMNELGIECGSEAERKLILTEEEVKGFFEVSKKAGKFIGIGVALCIISPALLIFINLLVGDGLLGRISRGAGDVLGLIPLFLLVAIGVSLFIYSDTLMKKYKYLEEDFELPVYLKTSIQQKSDAFTPAFTLSLVVGVVLCILSPVTLFITSIISDRASSYGVVLLLFIVAIAVYIFISFGTIKGYYNKLLKLEEYSREAKLRKKENKVIGAVAAIVWPIATCIFLVTGFVYQLWHINWIIFAITGILFGMFSGAYSIIKGDGK
jgi:hypothetical protein